MNGEIIMNENQKQYERVISDVPAFGMRDKIGYMSGDLANNLTFQFVSLFLMVFYTEVWGITHAVVGTLYAFSRVIDAFTDVTMGVIVDKFSAKEYGKFRPWIKYIMCAIAIASFLMYKTGLADIAMSSTIIYMHVTYIIW